MHVQSIFAEANGIKKTGLDQKTYTSKGWRGTHKAHGCSKPKTQSVFWQKEYKGEMADKQVTYLPRYREWNTLLVF